MNNDNLLRALIDALGFDIESSNNFDEKRYSAYLDRYKRRADTASSLGATVPFSPESPEKYTTIEYKLVKRVDKLKAIQDAHQIMLDDIVLKGKAAVLEALKNSITIDEVKSTPTPLVDNFCLSDKSLAFLKCMGVTDSMQLSSYCLDIDTYLDGYNKGYPLSGKDLTGIRFAMKFVNNPHCVD